ncbi:hypothetical protein J5N97_014802 [Dioscorea zingiberensis]|uniref:Glycosyltransferases n=1 Tax=Dioscorea zingiberensis TaxID=325984 RepID=A0A9D5CVV3_9LILI|nr:hypothetical protein J5N97_014802 [Dioscorea zingiberensis]
MGSFERSKKRIQLWKKALIHFSLCFVMGFFTGFAPTTTTSSIFSGQPISYRPPPPENIENLDKTTTELATLNRSLMSEMTNESSSLSSPESSPLLPTLTEENSEEEEEEEEESDHMPELSPRKLVIIITTTRSKDSSMQEVLLRRLSQTLSLVPPPLLWLVIEAQSSAPKTAETLRKTSVMYRHLTVKENFTDPRAEADHQRNLALNHIEHHRLNGIVHFASLSNVYDLQFFDEIRNIEVFGTWAVAMVGGNRKKVLVDGPVCSSLQVVGWRRKDWSSSALIMYSRNEEINIAEMKNGGGGESTGSKALLPDEINVSGFAFNSSILWDPERWGRSSSVPHTSQDPIKFVQQVVLEDETKLRAIPSDCSKIMLWNLHVPRNLTFHQR